MHHHVAHTSSGLAFHTWEEGLELFRRITRACPPVAAVVMPDHIHLLTPTNSSSRLRDALGAYTRWLNHRRGRRGPLWRPIPEPDPVVGADKRRRNERYIHLNPCRAGLVDDPLAWPLSTLLDAVGLAVDPVRRSVSDPHAYYRYTSSDPSVSVTGLLLPTRSLSTPRPDEVVIATAFLSRQPVAAIRRPRTAVRQLALQSLRALTAASGLEIAALADVSPQRVSEIPRAVSDSVRLVERSAGDPRFRPLLDNDLRHDPAWRRYRPRP